jgi:hypothetical protein
MTYKAERELKILISEAYFAGLDRKDGVWEALMERFSDIVEIDDENE